MAIRTLGDRGRGALAVDDAASPSGVVTLMVTAAGENPVATQETGANTGSTASVALTTASSVIRAANKGRRGLSIANPSGASLYLLLGDGTASATLFTVTIAAGGYYEAPFAFRGTVRGALASGTGNVLVTEYTG